MTQTNEHASGAMARDLAAKIAEAKWYAAREGFSVSTVSASPEEADTLIAALSAISAPEAQREGEDGRLAELSAKLPEGEFAAVREALERVEMVARARVLADPDRSAVLRDLLAEIDAACAFLASTGTEGRPIGSAPRDGTRLLLWSSSYAEYYVGYFEPGHDGRGVNAGWFTGEGSDIDPTHWWPLNAPTRSGALALHATSQPLPQEGGRVPDGWKLVPIEPPEKMREALAHAIYDDIGTHETYSAMLAAAPQPPLPSGAPDALAQGGVSVTDKMVEAACTAAFGEVPERGGLMWERMQIALDAAIAQAEAGTSGTSEDEEPERCLACGETLKPGDLVLPDAGGGFGHVECFGPEREGYTGADGGPLKDDEPIPTGWLWSDEIATAVPSGVYLREGNFYSASTRAGMGQEFYDRWIGRGAEFPPAPSPEPSRQGVEAIRDVLAERERQKSAEGWTPEHDDTHSHSELARAAACYAAGYETWVGTLGPGITRGSRVLISPSRVWPFDPECWNPTTPRRNLIKAGALILAEIERLDRERQRLQEVNGCTAGVGCDEYGGCYADAHGEPEKCPRLASLSPHGSGQTGGRAE